jgi:hypothetical protein
MPFDKRLKAYNSYKIDKIMLKWAKKLYKIKLG